MGQIFLHLYIAPYLWKRPKEKTCTCFVENRLDVSVSKYEVSVSEYRGANTLYGKYALVENENEYMNYDKIYMIT